MHLDTKSYDDVRIWEHLSSKPYKIDTYYLLLILILRSISSIFTNAYRPQALIPSFTISPRLDISQDSIAIFMI